MISVRTRVSGGEKSCLVLFNKNNCFFDTKQYSLFEYMQVVFHILNVFLCYILLITKYGGLKRLTFNKTVVLFTVKMLTQKDGFLYGKPSSVLPENIKKTFFTVF